MTMDDLTAGRMWDENAEVWTLLSRQGLDIYRDHINTPAFLAMLPDVSDKIGLDIGCGEGHNTRQLVQRGARMFALDISQTFVRYAQQHEAAEDIQHVVASAWHLPYPAASFDFATAFMCLMDVPQPSKALAEAYRVLKPGGFLQFSISHPCTNMAHRKWVYDAEGGKIALEVAGYFAGEQGKEAEFIFSQASLQQKESLRHFRIPTFQHTISEWMNMVVDCGFALERLDEPCASDEAVALQPHLMDARMIPYFLIVRGMKTG